MSINTIEQDFMNKVSAKVELLADGIGRFRVLTPFQFDDGDPAGHRPEKGRCALGTL